MCDTIGFVENGRSVFGKNSDRSPNEPQILEFFPAMHHEEPDIEATYITVPQVAETHAVLLSRPTWLWGAEIGVNDCGVCIGNEAVWTLGKYNDTGLTGMDMLRIALERSCTAYEAKDILINLLENYGQGGNCGFDHKFFYDNSFLIQDKNTILVLETADKKWVWKECKKTSISNRLQIANNGDCYSTGKTSNFRQIHSDPIYNIASGSAARRQVTFQCVKTAEKPEDLVAALSRHDENVENPFAQGTVSSVCMHFGGLVGDHTTSSMIVDQHDDKIVVWGTGSSCPCVSLFKPWLFGTDMTAPFFSYKDEEDALKYWKDMELFHRGLLGRTVPNEFYEEQNSIQQSWFDIAETLDKDSFAEFSAACRDQELRFYHKWKQYEFPKTGYSKTFFNNWQKKNMAF